ncbi:MAG: DNA-directed RNA polymerase [Nanoarchaeota archaeon]|nr:DNA-directed RNA polymerase [Nanoarchaeota archaeon]
MAEYNKGGSGRSFGGKKSFGDRKSFGEKKSYGDRGSFGPKELHDAKCSECGQDCQVPFKPTEGKPVYCRECFRKKRSY